MLSEFRKAKDDFFGTDPHSPLDHFQKDNFSGLNYYPENLDLRFDLPLEKVEKPVKSIMAISTGDDQGYFHVSQIRFT